MAGLALVGCGGDDDLPTPAPAAAAVARAAEEQGPPPRAADAPLAQEPLHLGGTLRLHATLTDVDSFDSHRSRSPVTQLFAALQQNRLIRFADVNAGILEPDLATLPEIPDEVTYVFGLRADVRWADDPLTGGRPLVADDVRLNIERQAGGVDAAGNDEPLFGRRDAYRRTAAAEVIDDSTLVVRAAEPSSTYLRTVHAGPWAFVQAPEVWEAFGDQPRDGPPSPRHYSGSGPFTMDGFAAQEEAGFKRNLRYFRAPGPGVDQLRVLNLVEPARQRQAVLDGKLDVWSPGDPREVDLVAEDFPEHRIAERPLPFALRVALSYRPGSPFIDGRLAIALHLALDRHALLEHAFGAHARVSGPAPWFADGWGRSADALALSPGYLPRLTPEDLLTVRNLVEAAGLSDSLEIAMPDAFAATYPGIDRLASETLGARLGLRVEIVRRRYIEVLRDLRAGAVGAVLDWDPPALDSDPTDRLLRSARTDGAENIGGFSSVTVDAALDRMQATFDEGERKAIYTEALEPQLLSAPNWCLPLGHGIQRSLVAPRWHLPPFGFGWDGHRYEVAFLDPGS